MLYFLAFVEFCHGFQQNTASQDGSVDFKAKVVSEIHKCFPAKLDLNR